MGKGKFSELFIICSLIGHLLLGAANFNNLIETYKVNKKENDHNKEIRMKSIRNKQCINLYEIDKQPDNNKFPKTHL